MPSPGDAPYRGVIIVRRQGDLVLPIDVELHTEAGLVETLRWDGRGQHTTFEWTGDSKLVAVVLDPEHKILIDQDLSNNVRRRGSSRLAPRVLSHVGHVAHLLMELAAP